MCDVFLEPCELWEEAKRKARKHHLCDCCWASIKPGETYTTHFSKHDGDVTSEKICTACVNDRVAFAKEHGDMTPTPSYFPTLLSNCVAEDDDSREVWQPILDRIRLSRTAAA
jgi:hypothetical protein